MTARAAYDALARADDKDDCVMVKLRLERPGIGGCEHRYRTWGHDPGTVTCTCGARWRGVLPRPPLPRVSPKDLRRVSQTMPLSAVFGSLRRSRPSILDNW